MAGNVIPGGPADPFVDVPMIRPRSRRRGRTVALGVAVVVAASVAFDVGHSATKGNRAADLTALVAQLNIDIASCNSSVGDSFDAYTQVVRGLSAERHAAEGIIAGDEPNCTPEANSDLYDMAAMEAPGTLRAYGVATVLTDLDTWAFPDGAAAIDDVGRLLVAPADPSARADLRHRLSAMSQLGTAAQTILDAAGRRLGLHVAVLDIGAAKRLGSGTF